MRDIEEEAENHTCTVFHKFNLSVTDSACCRCIVPASKRVNSLKKMRNLFLLVYVLAVTKF